MKPRKEIPQSLLVGKSGGPVVLLLNSNQTNQNFLNFHPDSYRDSKLSTNRKLKTVNLSGISLTNLIRIVFSLLVLFFFIGKSKAQTITDDNGILLPGIVVDGDTFAMVQLDVVPVVAEMKFATVKQKEAWDKLKYNVKKAYPFALIASARLREYETVLEKMPNEDMRKAYMKVAEAKLKKEFEGQLKQLTVKQGRILIKLIDRETGRTSYELVKQLRGNFSAWMWQGLASLFGSSLKSEYDSQGEDRMIETAIRQIEAGQF